MSEIGTSEIRKSEKAEIGKALKSVKCQNRESAKTGTLLFQFQTEISVGNLNLFSLDFGHSKLGRFRFLVS